MVKILAISGSLRSNSSNTSILRAMVGLAPTQMQISIYDGIGDLPYFNPELDDRSLLSVQNWRTQLQAADAILFCTPEYAHGVPGVLKNALDWIVSSGELMAKPAAVISASPSPDGGEKANASLVQTLRLMMADISAGTILLIPAVSAKLTDRGEINDPQIVQAIQSLLTTLAETVDRVSQPEH